MKSLAFGHAIEPRDERALLRDASHPVSVTCMALLVAVILSVPVRATAAPELTADGDPNGGFVTLFWGDRHAVVQLEEATSPKFDDPDVRYEGRHTSTVISGLPDGTYYYRIRHQAKDGSWGGWSEPLRFDVKHHSLALAAGLFGVGALVFLLTALFVIRAPEEV